MTLMSGRDGLDKTLNNQEIVLDFLRDEVWTRVDIIQDLLDYRSVQGAYKVLGKMEKLGLVRKFSLPIIAGRALTIWGITTHGLGMSFKGKWDTRPAFSPVRVRQSAVPHRLGLQALRVKCLKAGWKDWKLGKVFRKKDQIVPDAVVLSPAGVRVAIEYERELKGIKRYKEILIGHLENIKFGVWDEVCYVAPSKKVDKIRFAFHSIDEAHCRGERIRVTEKHLSYFRFVSEDLFPNF